MIFEIQASKSNCSSIGCHSPTSHYPLPSLEKQSIVYSFAGVNALKRRKMIYRFLLIAILNQNTCEDREFHVEPHMLAHFSVKFLVSNFFYM